MTDQSKPSQPRPLPTANYDFTCPGCGSKYIAKSSGCPYCRSAGIRGDDEITKKVMDDDMDLIK